MLRRSFSEADFQDEAWHHRQRGCPLHGQNCVLAHATRRNSKHLSRLSGPPMLERSMESFQP
jgi:hypothetical protein